MRKVKEFLTKAIELIREEAKLVIMYLLSIVIAIQFIYIDNAKKEIHEYKVRVALYDTIMSRQIVINENFVNSYGKHFCDTLRAIYGRPKFVKDKSNVIIGK